MDKKTEEVKQLSKRALAYAKGSSHDLRIAIKGMPDSTKKEFIEHLNDLSITQATNKSLGDSATVYGFMISLICNFIENGTEYPIEMENFVQNWWAEVQGRVYVPKPNGKVASTEMHEFIKTAPKDYKVGLASANDSIKEELVAAIEVVRENTGELDDNNKEILEHVFDNLVQFIKYNITVPPELDVYAQGWWFAFIQDPEFIAKHGDRA